MKIKYNNKNIALPFKFEGENKSHSTELVTRRNPFSGQSIELPAFAAAVYDYTISSNLKEALVKYPFFCAFITKGSFFCLFNHSFDFIYKSPIHVDIFIHI